MTAPTDPASINPAPVDPALADPALANPALLERAARVRLLALDVDGVLTDGRLLIDPDGREWKSFHARDGHGLKLLRETGVEVAVISGRRSPAVVTRMNALGIERVHQEHDDKWPVMEQLLQELSLEPGEAAFVGDDVLDLPLLVRVGFAVAVADAHPLVAAHVHWTTARPGGAGAVREVCDLLLAASGELERIHARYLKRSPPAPLPPPT